MAEQVVLPVSSAPVAIKAMAAKGLDWSIACCATAGHSSTEERSFTHRKLQINYLKHKAANLPFQIIAALAT